MANSIALAQKFQPLLDEVYKRESLTSIFDVTAARMNFVGADTVKVFKTDMDGLADYDRNSGFKSGSVTGAWETFKLSQDRGVSFMVDRMDNEETLGMAFGTLAGEFIRTKVVPELDAYRFSKLAGATGITKATAADISADTDVAAMIDTALAEMGDNEVPREGLVCFMSEKTYSAFKGNITRYLANENGVNREINSYNGIPIVRVPKNRFNTGITLNDGESKFGYEIPKTTSFPINFMLIHPSAVTQVTKHALPRIFDPDTNQKADAWQFDYRVYHDIFTFEKKANGIYLSAAATANA